MLPDICWLCFLFLLPWRLKKEAEAFRHRHAKGEFLINKMNIHNCPGQTIQGRAACGGVSLSAPGRNIWTARSGTERATEEQRQEVLIKQTQSCINQTSNIKNGEKGYISQQPKKPFETVFVLPYSCVTLTSSGFSPCGPGCGWWRRSLSPGLPAALCVSSPSCRAWRRSEASSQAACCRGREARAHGVFIHTTGFHQKHCSTLVTHHKLTWRHCCCGNRCAARTGRRPAGQQQQQCWLAGCTERKRGSVCRCRGGEEREDGRTAERQGERLKHLV